MPDRKHGGVDPMKHKDREGSRPEGRLLMERINLNFTAQSEPSH